MPDEQMIISQKQDYESLKPVVEKADDFRRKTYDFVFDNPNDVNFQMSWGAKAVTFKNEQGSELSYNLTPFSTTQLCNRLKMPVQYFDMLASQQQEAYRSLAVVNINTLLKHSRKDMMLRTLGTDVRGVLSAKYSPFDTHEILDVFTSVTENCFTKFTPETIRVRGSFLTPERFHLRFTTGEPMAVDKDLYCGLQIDSSDVGKAQLTVRFFIFKQVCTNGMCISRFSHELYKQRHIGIRKDEFEEGLRRSFVAFPLVAEQAEQAVRLASQTNLNCGKLFSKEDNEKLHKDIQSYLRVTENELEDIVALVYEKYPPTLWGFVNAVTERVQGFDFERRLETERMAGNFLFDYKRFGLVA